jgi:hypothetical protein
MKILATVFVFFGMSATCLAAESWLRGVPATWPNGDLPQQLPLSTYVELPISMFEAAAQELREHAAVKLPDYGPDNYRRKDLICPDRTRPYLVRAVYTNGTTGGYYLHQVGNILWVSHQSLGRSTGAHRSALLACLPFEPSEVYVTAGGAM